MMCTVKSVVFEQIINKMIYILTVKKRRNWHRHDYSEHDDSGKVNIQQVLLMLLGIKPFNCSVKSRI